MLKKKIITKKERDDNLYSLINNSLIVIKRLINTHRFKYSENFMNNYSILKKFTPTRCAVNIYIFL